MTDYEPCPIMKENGIEAGDWKAGREFCEHCPFAKCIYDVKDGTGDD